MNIIQASRVEKGSGKYVEALALMKDDGRYFNLIGKEIVIDETIVFTPLPDRIYQPKWNFEKKVWEEGLSQDRILEELRKQKREMDQAVLEITLLLSTFKEGGGKSV